MVHDPFAFVDASREQILVKAALCGPPGSGKTRSALGIATAMSRLMDLGDIYLIDSENRSSLKYALNPRSGKGFRFKALHMPSNDYSPQTYMKAIHAAEAAGAKVIIIDSISHAWEGPRGILEQVDALTEASRSKNAFSEGWRKATPIQRQFVQAILASPAHIFATMRSDPEWVVQENEKGKKEPVMIGLAPKQRKDISFEFDLVLDMKIDHTAVVGKTRCEELTENAGVWKFPGENVARVLVDWIGTGGAAAKDPVAEALDAAVADGVAAARDKAKDRYQAARQALIDRCKAAGATHDTITWAVEQFKVRVTAEVPATLAANGEQQTGIAQEPKPVVPSRSAGDFVVPFGKSKGKRISEVENGDLEWLSGALEKDLTDPSKARFHEAARERLVAIENELASRDADKSHGKSADDEERAAIAEAS